MRFSRFLAIVPLAVMALAIGSCSSSQLASWQAGLNNFQAGVASVDQTIANVSPVLAKYCGQAQVAGQALVPLVSQSKAASGGLAAINAAITTWCQSPPTDIASAVNSIAAEVSAAKAAYAAAQKGN